MKQKDWLKVKSYTHLTPKIPLKEQNWIRLYVQNTSKIESHRFYPMLHYTIVDKKYRRPKLDGRKNLEREFRAKHRDIFYSNHLDSHVYSYYASILNNLLNEKYTSDETLMNSVIAYRSIPFNKKRNKCNIDFAYEAFNFIKENRSLALSAVCLDVSNYFPSINHKKLKMAWADLLQRNDLPKHHYKVFKSITKFSYIEISDVFKLTPLHKIEKLMYLKSKSIESFFRNGEEFRKSIQGKNLIRVNRKKCGIPQGSPISAVLSNLYLLDFDNLMIKLSKQYNGLYRRYSDDIVFICDPKWIDNVKTTINKFLTETLLLEIQDKKTQRVDFHRVAKDDQWQTTLIEQGYKYKGRPLTYLGFDFDGKKIRIKQKSISSYYRKTKRNIKRAAFFALKTKEIEKNKPLKNNDPWIYRTKIYKLKTHLGARKKTIDNKIFWGNYLSYVYNASRIMKEKGIKKQLRNHWKIVENKISFYNDKYGLAKSSAVKKK